MYRSLLLACLVFCLGELLTNFVIFRYIRNYFSESAARLNAGSGLAEIQQDEEKEGLKFLGMPLSAFKGMLERFVLFAGLHYGFVAVMALFGTLKLGTRFKGADENPVSNDYFLLGNFASVLMAIIYTKVTRLLIASGFLLAAGCTPAAPDHDSSNTSFDSYKAHFMTRYWKTYPAHASSVGYHNYDSVLVVPDAAAREKELAFLRTELRTLRAFHPDQLSAGNSTDFHLVENNLESKIWELNTFKSWEWDPSGYNVCGSFAEMITNKYDKPEVRLRAISKRLLAVPAYYAAAKTNIHNPTKEHTQLAIDQNLGGLSVFTTDLRAALETSSLSADEKTTLLARSGKAQEAITGYANWLKSLENPDPRSFRLGKKLYAEKFGFDIQAAASPEAIYRKALNQKGAACRYDRDQPQDLDKAHGHAGKARR